MRSGTIESKVDSTEDFRRWRLAPPGPDDPDVRIVGAISERMCEALAGLRHEPRTLAITVSRRAIGHALRGLQAEARPRYFRSRDGSTT